MNLQAISESVLGKIEWRDDANGFLKCPGENLHTGRTSSRDCKIYLNGAPTIYCFHQSCYALVEEYNLRLRKALCGENPRFPATAITQDEKDRIKAATEKAKIIDSLKGFSGEIFSKIQLKYKISIDKIISPTPLLDPENHWKQFIQLFDPKDILWNGDVKDSGRPENGRNFQMACEFLGTGVLGNFTCASTFKPNTYSRSNENVETQKFLVVESDVLSKEEILGVFRWCKTFLTLRAVVDTAGKSLHGWFEYPSTQTIELLKILLPELGCDRALFKASQPVRMPGANRDGKTQKLLWLELRK